jgi:GTPase
LQIPIILVITYSDLYDPTPIQQKLYEFVNEELLNFKIVEINSQESAIEIGKKVIEENWIPLIKISNKTGQNMENLKIFLSLIPAQNKDSDEIEDNDLEVTF